MTIPTGPVVGRIDLNDGLNTRFDWAKASGLADGTATTAGATVETFGETVRILPGVQQLPPREITLAGYLLNAGGMAEGWQRLGQAQEAMAGRPTRLQVGSLALSIQTTGLRPDRLRAYGGRIDYTMQASALPGAWEAMYTYGIQSQGIAASRDVPDISAYEFTGPRFTIANPGTAPTPLVLSIDGPPASTVVYVRCTAPGYSRRVIAYPSGAANATPWIVTEAMGLYIPPGSSEIRIEAANGSLLASATGVNTFGTRWRYVGNDDNRMSDPLTILTWQRRDTATVVSAAGSSRFIAAGEPRFGTILSYDSTKAGLIVELARTNLLTYSQDLSQAVYAKTGLTSIVYTATAPDGTNTAMNSTSNAADSYINRSFASAAGATTFTVWLRTNSGTNTINIYLGDGAGSTNTACSVDTTWKRFQVTRSMSGAGHYIQIGGGATWSTGEILNVWGNQVEAGPFPTTYIPTVATTVERSGDLGGYAEPQNLLLRTDQVYDWTATLGAGTRGGWYPTNATLGTREAFTTGMPGWRIASTVANGYAYQPVVNSEYLAGRYVTLSAWVRPANGATCSLTIGQTSTGFTGATSPTGDGTTWYRLATVTRIAPDAFDSEVRISHSVIGNLAVFGPMLSATADKIASGLASSYALPSTYVLTIGNQALPEGAWEWPSWLTQNGYIEAQVILPINGLTGSGSTSGVQYFILGNSSQGLYIERASGTAAGTNTVTAGARSFDSSGSATVNTLSANLGAIFDGAFHTVRLEWQHYNLAGTRYMYLRVLVDGSQVAITANLASGAAQWASYERFFPFQSQSQGIYRNIRIGAPTLPAGAVPIIV